MTGGSGPLPGQEEGEPHRLTINIYRLAPNGLRTPLRTVTVSEGRPFTRLPNPGTFPPCQCPRHRGRE